MELQINDSFNKVDQAVLQRKELLKKKLIFEKVNKNNSVLKEYIDILKGIEEADKEIEASKAYMYDLMLEKDTDLLEGKNINISLKRPYEKTSLNSKLFLEDYKPGSRMYNKYVRKTICKGNITIKEIEE